MKKYVLIIFAAIFSISCMAQDRDGTMTIDDTLFVSNVFEYQDSIIDMHDITFHQFSTNGSDWTKDTTGANWVRFSNQNKSNWWLLPYSAFENYWTVTNDTLQVINGYVVDVDSLNVNDYINTLLYKQGGDSLAIEDLDGSGGTEGQVAINRSGKPVWEDFPAGTGETNTMENSGTSGVGVYDNKAGVKFNMRNIATIDTFIDVDLNAADSTIDLSWDGSGRYVATSVMLTGGGTLDANRTLSLDIDGGVATDTVAPAADYIAMYDASAGAHRKVLVSDIVTSDSLAYVDSVYVENIAPFRVDRLKYNKEGTEYDVTELPKQDGIIDGGNVIWQSGLIFDISACAYRINGTYYSTATQSDTLTTADVTNPRIDVLVVDTNSVVTVITGIPAASPQKPTPDPQSQLELTFVTVEAGATAPTPPSGETLIDSVIYNENVEWTTSATGVVVDFNSAISPYIGSVSASISTITDGDILTFTGNDTDNNFSTLSFFLKKKKIVLNKHGFKLRFYLNSVGVSDEYKIDLFDEPNFDWENIVVDLKNINFTNDQFDQIQLEYWQKGSTSNDGYYLDYLKVQGGFTQPSTVIGVDLYVNDTLKESTIAQINLIESGIVDLTYAPTGKVTINATEVDGSVTNEIQDLWDVITSDSGNTTASSSTDNLIVVGEQGFKTRISNDTLYVKQNDNIQALTGVSDTLDIDVGLHATHTMSGVDTIFIDNLFDGATGNITVACQAADDSLFFSGGTIKISPILSSVNGAIPVTNGASAIDVYSYWYDGTRIIINGTKNYD